MTDAQELPPDFSFGGWEGHADRERRLGLKTTPAQRLEWLEEAMGFVQMVEARRAAGTLFASGRNADPPAESAP